MRIPVVDRIPTKRVPPTPAAAPPSQEGEHDVTDFGKGAPSNDGTIPLYGGCPEAPTSNNPSDEFGPTRSTGRTERTSPRTWGRHRRAPRPRPTGHQAGVPDAPI